jgi:hypothetical protein
MDKHLIPQMEQFIVLAKRATYVGGGDKLLPYRLGSKDLQFKEGAWVYHDSYLGESDFIGQEVVYYQLEPVWGMNYYGRLLRPDHASAQEMGQMIMKSLTEMYKHNRFLGGFEYADGDLRYVDRSEGPVTAFEGREQIYRDDELVYQLLYHGGLIQK